jgi:hypothetical protein
MELFNPPLLAGARRAMVRQTALHWGLQPASSWAWWACGRSSSRRWLWYRRIALIWVVWLLEGRFGFLW